MNKYNITIQRMYDESFEIEAENEEEALEKANDLFDDMHLCGYEMYNYNEEIVGGQAWIKN